jgi:hypothetical protein
MEHNSNGTSISTSTAASKQLQRRLSGLGRSHWNTETDVELLAHLFSAQVCNLTHLDILSDCIMRMAEHGSGVQGSDKNMLVNSMVVCQGYSILCKVLGSALQQLAEGVQQYLQQEQLPAALTVRAVEACYALCFVLVRVCDCLISSKHGEGQRDHHLRQTCYSMAVVEGALDAVLQPVVRPSRY